MSGLAVTTITDAADLTGLAGPWRDLRRRCPAATPFQSPSWLLPWWEAFAPGRLATVAVRRGPDLVALAPLYRHVDAHGDRLMPVGVSLSDYGDVLADPGEPDALPRLSEALGALAAPAIELHELRPGATALALPLPAAFADGRHPGQPCPVLGPLAPDDPMAAVPAGQRRKWRMAGHRAARRGGSVVDPADPARPEGVLRVLEELHQRRWRDRGEPGIFADPRVGRFLRRALPALAAEGLAETLLVRIGGTVAGAYCGLRDHGAAYAWCGAFDDAFARESPGTLMVGHLVQATAARGAGELHFLRGSEAYKHAWGAVDRRNTTRILRRG